MNQPRIKKLAITTSLFLIIAVFISGLAFSQGYGQRMGKRGGGYGYAQSFPDRGPILRTEMFNARIAILAEMTGQSTDAIQSKLRYKPMWALMDEYKVDYESFSEKVIAKRIDIIKQAVSDGRISQQRADFMLQRAEDGFVPGKGGPGMRAGHRGHRGGWGARAGDCPRY